MSRNMLCSGVASAWIPRISYRSVDMVVIDTGWAVTVTFLHATS